MACRRYTVLLLATLVSFAALCNATLIVNWGTLTPQQTPRNDTSTYESVPVVYDGNQYRFEPVSGEMVSWYCTQCNFTDRVVILMFTVYKRPFIEEILNQLAEAKVRAVVIAGEGVEENANITDLGAIQSYYNGIRTTAVTYPVINIRWTSWYDLLANNFTNGSSVVVNVTSEGNNNWYELRVGWWFPFQTAILLAFSLVNIILAARALYLLPLRIRHIANLCLWLEVVASIIRILWAMDPWGYDVFPTATSHIFLTASYPFTLAVSTLLLFWWWELVNKNSLEIIRFLKKTKWLAIAIVIMLFVLEIVTSSLRAAGLSFEVEGVYLANRICYFAALIFLLCCYVYVAISVVKFLSKLTNLRTGQKVLRRVSMFGLLAALAYLMLISSAALFLLDFYLQSFGESFTNFYVHLASDLASLAHILAFTPDAKGKSATSVTTAGRSVNSTK